MVVDLYSVYSVPI